MLILGIDCGLSGAIAISNDGALTLLDMPVLTIERGGRARRELDAASLADWVKPLRVDHAFVEQIWGRGTSEASAFASAPLLISYGIVIGVLAAARIPVTKVAPQRWKAALAVPKGKDAARARASELMPQYSDQWARKKDDGRAEAALIAMYGARQLGQIMPQTERREPVRRPRTPIKHNNTSSIQ